MQKVEIRFKDENSDKNGRRLCDAVKREDGIYLVFKIGRNDYV